MEHQSHSITTVRFLAAAAVVVTALAGATPVRADYIGTLAGNYSGVNGYTYLSIVNTDKKDATVTVKFINEDDTEVASVSQLLESHKSWTLSSQSGFTGVVATGDFNGYVRVQSTRSDKKLALFGMLAFPVDGSGSIGNPLAITGASMSWTRAK